jgi:hypothetical protein
LILHLLGVLGAADHQAQLDQGGEQDVRDAVDQLGVEPTFVGLDAQRVAQEPQPAPILGRAPALPAERGGRVDQRDLSRLGVAGQLQPGRAPRPKGVLAGAPRGRADLPRGVRLDRLVDGLEQHPLVGEVVVERAAAHPGAPIGTPYRTIAQPTGGSTPVLLRSLSGVKTTR